MLRPLLRGILCGLLLDNVLVAALAAGGSFLFDYYVPGPLETDVPHVRGLEILWYWLMYGGGVLLASILAAALGYRVPTVLPQLKRIREVVVEVLIYSSTLFTFIFYDVDMDNSAGVFREAFANGIFISMVLLWVSMFVINFVLHVAGFSTYGTTTMTIYTNNNRAAVYVCTVVMLIDMCTFEHSWVPALLLVAFVATVRILRILAEGYAAMAAQRALRKLTDKHKRQH